MTRLPRLSGKEVVKALERHDFAVRRVRGSHHFMQHDEGRTTVVPVHANETLGPGLLRKILRDCELTIADLTT